MSNMRATCLVLLMAVVSSSVALAWSKHRARELYQTLEKLSQAQDESQLEWGRLQLEQATWSENSRVEQIARERLGLQFPGPESVMVINQ